MVNRSQKGFSLVEVLVAVVILALGLLGFAALQVTALRYASNSAVKFAVSRQVNDIMDRIRANKAALTSTSNYSLASTTGSCPTATTTMACGATTCTPAAMAAADLSEWNAQNGCLPGGAGSVTTVTAANNSTTPATPAVVTITISWRERGAFTGSSSSNSNTKTYSITTMP